MRSSTDFVQNFSPILEDKVQYLYIYFKLAYYFCAVPFRFERESYTPGAILMLKKRKYQQIFCGIVYIWGVYKYIPSLYATKFNKSRIASFDFIALLASFCCRISFIYFMTRKQLGFLGIVNFIREDQINSRKIYKKGKISWLVGALTCAYCTIGAIYTITGIGIEDAKKWNFKDIWSTYCGQMRFNLFLEGKIVSVPFQEISVVGHIGNGFLVISLLMHHLSRDFVELMNNKDEKINTITERFWQLKHGQTEVISPIYGNMILLWIVEALPYYSGNLDAIFSENNVAKQVRNILYIINFFTTILVAADAHYKISQVKDWLMERRDQLRMSELQFSLIMHALSPSEIGLKNGFFVITYVFLATLGNVIITYAIILINFNGSDQVSFHGYNNIL